ncbi:MAG: DUF2939 domain-containing protein [Bacteroidota bacterium]|jgi:hypothetical protein
MKRLLIPLLLVLALVGFYAAWPAWSLYQVRESIRTDDGDTLARKIDFPSVRTSLRPVLTEEAQRIVDRVQGNAGGLGALLGQLKGDLLPKIVDAGLDVVVTPENVMHIARNREALRDALRRAVAEKASLGSLGGLRKKKAEAAEQPTSGSGGEAAPAAPAGEGGYRGPRYTVANIKSFAIAGPLSFDIGVNRKAEATEPEVIVGLAFTGGDWKIVRLVPRL